jgi:hypothetical protein
LHEYMVAIVWFIMCIYDEKKQYRVTKNNMYLIDFKFITRVIQKMF